MADDNLQHLEKLLDKKLSPINARLDELQKQTAEGFTSVNKRLDLVAGHLAEVDNQLFKVEATQKIHTRQLTAQDAALARMERHLVKKDDRLDSHGERIEKLERKTVLLPDR